MNKFKTLLPAAAAVVLLGFGAEAAPIKRTATTDAATYKTTTTVAAPATRAEETWKDLGEGWFRDDTLLFFYFLDPVPEFAITVQESEQTPGRYRIVNPYKNFPHELLYQTYMLEGDRYMIVDASDPDHVFIEQTRTGYVIGLDEASGVHKQMLLWTVADDYYNNVYGDWELAEEEGMCGKIEDNVITFPMSSVLVSAERIDKTETDFIWGRNITDQFRIKLPAALDLDMKIRLIGPDESHTGVMYEVTPQDDVTKARIALVAGAFDREAVDKIVDGTIESMEVTTFGDITVPYTGDGVFTFYAIPVVDGVAKPYMLSYLTRQFDYDESVWRKCGLATFHEGSFSSSEVTKNNLYLPEAEYPVEVEQNVDNPGLIRMVNAYGGNSPYATSTCYDFSQNYYIELDIDDPDAVSMKHSPSIGLDYGYGRMGVWSRADRYFEQGKTKEEIRELEKDGLLFGTHKNNVITFPKDALLIEYPDVTTSRYWANSDGKWKLSFSEGQLAPTGVSLPGVDSSDTTPHYYNTQGVEVAPRDLAPGIYVVRRGGVTSKIVVK